MAAPYARHGQYGSGGGDDDPYFEGEHERPDTIGAYYGAPDGVDDGGVRLRDRHQSFRTGAGARMQRGPSTGAGGPPPRSPSGLSGIAGGADEAAMAAARKFRRRWDEPGGSGGGAREEDVRGAGAASDASVPQRPANTGHLVRMRRSEAWGKFLAYEGSCQVCMVEGAKGNQDASYFLSSGCAPLRTGLGITGLLLPAVLPAHLAASEGGSIDLGNEIVWDDCDADKRLNAGAFVNRMSVIRLRVAKLSLPGRGTGWWSKITCKKGAPYSEITVHLRMAPIDPLAPVDVRFRLGSTGASLPGSPTYELQPDYANRDVVLEVSDGYGVLARGAVSCKRLWQIGMEHAPLAEGDDGGGGGFADDDAPLPPAGDGAAAGGNAGPGGICSWFKEDGGQVPLHAGATGIWVTVFGEGGASGQVLLSIARVQREMPAAEGADPTGAARGTLKVSSCQAYDYLLMAALRAQLCDERRLEVSGEWSWLLTAFAGHYGVRSNYAIMSHLRWVLKPGVASVSRPCFDLLSRQMRPLLEQEQMGGSLTQQESTMLTRIKRDAEELLKLCFENYHLLSSAARKGILEANAGLTNHPPGAGGEFPPEALVAGMGLLEVMRDVFLPSDAEWLTDRFRLAAKARWARLAMACDDGQAAQEASPSNPLLAAPLRQALSGKAAAAGSPANRAAALYGKMSQVAAAIVQDIEYDRRLQDVPRLLPSALNLPAITAGEYCANYVVQLRAVLGAAPPHQPTEVAIDMLVAVAGLQRYLEEHGLAPPRGGPSCIDALELFGHHVRSWLTNSQEGLCAAARSLEATTELSAVTGLGATQPAAPAGGSEEGGVAPIVHEMLRAVVNEMHRYERVICHWPVFGPHLEASLCCVLRTIMAAVSRQCGMTKVRGGGGDAMMILSGHGHGLGGGSPYRGGAGGRGAPGGGYAPPEYGGRSASRLAAAGANQWAWTAGDSPRRAGGAGGGGGGGGAPRCLLMVREAVLLNSLKRLMVAVPSYEASINRWGGGASAPPPGVPQSPTRGAADAAAGGARQQSGGGGGGSGGGGGFDPYSYSDDVAPHVGAQFAQVVKELRTEYAAAVGACAERVSLGLASAPPTSVRAILAAAKSAVAAAGANPSALQQQAMMEGLADPLFRCLEECLANLQAALDSRVFVAVGRGLWDFIGRQMYDFIEQLQEGADHKGAWRSRQNASLLLGLINAFFKGGLLAHMEHGLQDRDLAVPLHIDACLKLLASNTTALNSSFTPF